MSQVLFTRKVEYKAYKYHPNTPGHAILMQYIRGLRVELRNHVRLSDPKTLEDAIRQVELKEQALLNESRIKSINTFKTVNSLQYKMEEEENLFKELSLGDRVNQINHSNQRSRYYPNKVKCYNCRKLGHYSSQYSLPSKDTTRVQSSRILNTILIPSQTQQ